MGKIYVIGMGPGSVDCLTKGALDRIHSGKPNYLRTESHPTVQYFIDSGIAFETFDHFYEKATDFSTLYADIAQTLIAAAEEHGEINYYVPGNAMVAEKSVVELLNRSNDIEIISGMSFIEPIIELMKSDIVNGLKIVNGEELTMRDVDVHCDIIITQVYNERILSRAKLELSEVYGDEYRIFLIHSAGIPGDEKIIEIPIYELDRVPFVGSLSTIFVPKIEKCDKKIFDFNDILCIMEVLRGVDGCPWDIQQSHESLRTPMIEEAYEAVQAINDDDMDSLYEELGDVLLQVVFHSQIAREDGDFNIYSVTSALAKKMIYRHPHVFGTLHSSNVDAVFYNWDRLKYEKRGIHTLSEKLADMRGLPALLAGFKMQKKASLAGLNLGDCHFASERLSKQLDDLKVKIANGCDVSLESEVGELLFSMVGLCRFLEVDPEVALGASLERFKRQISTLEQQLYDTGRSFEDLTEEELAFLWAHIKKR